MSDILLEVDDLKLHFPQKSGLFSGKPKSVKAVDGVSFSIQSGETLGLVGESGCGKSSLGKALLNLHRPTGGSVRYQGRNIAGLSDREMRPLRRDLQMIFQDPFESLNSRHTVESIIEEPLQIHKIGDQASRKKRVQQLLELVGLPDRAANKYPHEFSGGQRQRIGIARAIALEPKLLICDEPVSALDVSVQAQILNLLIDIQQELGLAMLFISHDLSVVRHMSDRIAVMYLGKLAELAPAETVYQQPRHPYSQTLLSALPVIGKPAENLVIAKGDLPSPLAPPPGCRFHTRCPYKKDHCAEAEPVLQTRAQEQHWTACHYWPEIASAT
ncbi:oligopeptide/dipeptide ABC transporter, ATP-binding protein [Spongiibacter sp. IMCC21906]|uniref:ABC transporter ATP-binding protein n=1 Tax=Spongiibacter sp. IMCC21906 TaxID=1620392 RepID=UPI00062E0C54|nr:oligopeptide/dipeptide ABC transporter ATP-binding protein [Spongiibacter sp. IMCC21906]AKH69783.1 oligopeptide/dipeptide ABC transporter, ATP-binding protein [Spongiibacter sp. IMCC21906]